MKYLLLITNLISIALLIITAQLADLFISHPIERPAHVHKTLLLDRNFSQDEVLYIMQAAAEWTEATNHVAELDVILLPNTNEMLDNDSIIMTRVSPDSPDILIQESVTSHLTLGLYTRRQGVDIIEIVTPRLLESQYKEVVLHELGHALGLDHTEGLEGVDTLMCPYIDFGADHITPTDIEKFCKIYHCSKH